MSDRSQRFVDPYPFDRTGRLPVQLLKLFQATNLKHMMEIARNYSTDLETLQREAHNYMGKLQVQQCVMLAAKQSKLPVECAFAIYAYTRNDFYQQLNELLRSGKDLQEFRYVCICLIKALALLPAYHGKVYRGVTPEQLQDVCLKLWQKEMSDRVADSSSCSTATNFDVVGIFVHLH